jgi:hypothetical protein
VTPEQLAAEAREHREFARRFGVGRASAPAAAGACRAHCESHYCGLTAGHGGLHETPASEWLSTGERRFGDLYPAGWRRGDSLAADRGQHDARARELSRMRKSLLRDFTVSSSPMPAYECSPAALTSCPKTS